MNAPAAFFDVLLRTIRHEARDLNSYRLERRAGGELPAFDAGAHVDVEVAPGLVRSYSLAGDPADRSHYLLGIALDAASRGGSRAVHERWRVGQTLRIGAPRNLFPLVESASHSVLIAGGVGITPLLSMARRLTALGQPWTMHLAARSRAHAAFVDELAVLARATPGSTLDVHADDERGGPPDLKAWVGAAPHGAHLYACGPRPMLDAYRAATASRPADHVHWESFVPAEEAAVGGGFRLVLARQGRQLDVPPGKTMLDVLLDAGVDVPYGCMQGVCGSCQTRVLAGVPDHRDGILDDATRARNDCVIVCCSGSRTPELTLDL